MKVILLIALIAVVAFAQRQQVVGGFKRLNPEQIIQELQQETSTLKTAILKAREEYSQINEGVLGDIINISEQIVSGINYRILFHAGSEKILITVYCQAWTDTYEVTQMKKYIQAQ